ALAVGYRRAGFPGLLTAGVAFIAPAAVMTATLAWAYVRYGTLPGVVNLLLGTGPAVIAVMALGIVRLGRTALIRWQQVVIAVAVTALSWWGVDPVLLLALAAAVGLGLGVRSVAAVTLALSISAHGVVEAVQTAAASGGKPTLAAVGGFFLEVGAVLYGS